MDSESDSPAFQWCNEAQGVIKDISALVKQIDVSKSVQSSNHKIYLNIETLDKESFCVELSALGFRIVGKAFDVVDIDSDDYFDTPYSLLSKISPSYTNKFAQNLIDKLNQLEKYNN